MHRIHWMTLKSLLRTQHCFSSETGRLPNVTIFFLLRQKTTMLNSYSGAYFFITCLTSRKSAKVMIASLNHLIVSKKTHWLDHICVQLSCPIVIGCLGFPDNETLNEKWMTNRRFLIHDTFFISTWEKYSRIQVNIVTLHTFHHRASSEDSCCDNLFILRYLDHYSNSNIEVISHGDEICHFSDPNNLPDDPNVTTS